MKVTLPAKGRELPSLENICQSTCQDVPDRAKAREDTRIGVAVGIDAELAAPTMATELGLRSSLGNESVAPTDTAHLIDFNRPDAQPPQKTFRLPQLRGVLIQRDHPDSQRDLAFDQLPQSANGPIEAALSPGDPIVGFGVGGVEGTGDADLESPEYSQEVVGQTGGIGEDLDLSETDLSGMLDEQGKIWVKRRFSPDELHPAATDRTRIFEHALPIAETHPLDQGHIRP